MIATITTTGKLKRRVHATGPLLLAALRKGDPRELWHNPVLLLVEAGATLTTLVAIVEPLSGRPNTSGGGPLPTGFSWTVAALLWLTLYVANIAEALAEGRRREETAALRSLGIGATARRIRRYHRAQDPAAYTADLEEVDAGELQAGDHVVVEGGGTIPSDGEVVWGIASVDESAITGEWAAVIREAGTDRTGVTGGTRVLSDRIVVRVTAPRGNTLVDRMLGLAESARRQKAPNELALFSLLASFSLSFVLIALTLNAAVSPVAAGVSIPILVALVVCLIPAEVAALLSVTGIASMQRLLRHNVVVSSSHDLETAGEITTLILDKTGTITMGDRTAVDLVPVAGATAEELIRAAVLASLEDPTPEGVSTLRLAAERDTDAVTGAGEADARRAGRPVPFSAQTRLSGRDLPDGTSLRKGAETAVLGWLKHEGNQQPRDVVAEVHAATTAIARTGGTPLVVAIQPGEGAGRVLGVIHLKDVVKKSVPERIGRLRALGIRTVLVTGDNPLTAAAIAREAGIDEHLGDATSEAKLAFLREAQARGHFVAMTGDGINDVPALAQADIGVAMNTATGAAKRAATMVVIDDDPARIIDIIEIGRQQMATRGALTTFNFANDLVRYFALYPALFVGTFPGLHRLNVLRLHSPASAVVSTLIFGIVVIAMLIQMALQGVPYRASDLGRSLTLNVLVNGGGGILAAAVGIKAIDLVVSLLPGY